MILKSEHIRFIIAMRKIMEGKTARRVEPATALERELSCALNLSRGTIRRIGAELAVAGEIKAGDTIHQKYYTKL